MFHALSLIDLYPIYFYSSCKWCEWKSLRHHHNQHIRISIGISIRIRICIRIRIRTRKGLVFRHRTSIIFRCNCIMGTQARMVKPLWAYYDYMLKFGGVMMNTDHTKMYLPDSIFSLFTLPVFLCILKHDSDIMANNHELYASVTSY